MSRAFSAMKTNVGNNVQDTSTTFGTILGVYINKRYKQIIRKINWNIINEDYTVSVLAGTQDYTLPTDFKTEVYAVDVTNKAELTNVDLQDLAKNYPGELTTSGTSLRYTIFNSDDGSKYLRLHFNPVGNFTLAFPYIINPIALSGATDTNVLDFEDLLELGATADAWRYKRRFQKGQAMDRLFEKELSEYIFAQENQQNKVQMFNPKVYNKNDLY